MEPNLIHFTWGRRANSIFEKKRDASVGVGNTDNLRVSEVAAHEM